MRTARLRRAAACLALMGVLLSSAGVAGCGDEPAAAEVAAAIERLEASISYRVDLEGLNARIASLGEGVALEDTLLEGASIIRAAGEDIANLRLLYQQADAHLVKAIELEPEGRYGSYAGLSRHALGLQQEALDAEERLMLTLEEMLSVVPYASLPSELDWYVELLESRAAEFTAAAAVAAAAADAADSYYRDNAL
ncbi:MAG: hypothetical protein ACYC55_07790 [Candidatus Geothermincolia bacterium]